MLVLTSARKLKTSNGYDNVYVREGFWETVQEKRHASMILQRELRQDHIAKLSFDKLVTEGVYTYDVFTDRIRSHNRRDKPRTPMFHDTMKEFNKAVAAGKKRVPETFIKEPPLIHDQPYRQNTDHDQQYRQTPTTTSNTDRTPTRTNTIQTEHRPGPVHDPSDHLL